MAVNLKVVLDTNVIISAIGYGGKPGKVFLLALEEKIQGITSEILLAEVQEILTKKLSLLPGDLELTMAEIEDKFEVVAPRKTLRILRDEDDNRVLEAAVEGSCRWIVTGDKQLLALSRFRGIKIVSVGEFLKSA